MAASGVAAARRRALLLAALALPALAGQSFTVSMCPATSIFDAASLSCSACGTTVDNMSPNPWSRDVFGNSNDCACKTGYAPVPRACALSTSSSGCPTDSCSDCLSQGMTTPRDNTGGCIPCDGATTLGLDAVLGDCRCFSAAQTSGTLALVDKSVTGSALTAKTCAACPARTRVFTQKVGYWKADAYACQSCGDARATLLATGECVCDAGTRAVGLAGLMPVPGQVWCLDTSALALLTGPYAEATAAKVRFSSIQPQKGTGLGADATAASRRDSTLESKYHAHLYPKAAVGCMTWKAGDVDGARDCQVLGNLCALQLYNPSAPACALAASLTKARGAAVHGFQGWPTSLPFLAYSQDASSVLSEVSSLARTMAFDSTKEAGTSDTVQLFLAKYALNGTLLGVEAVTNQFAYCGGGGSKSDKPAWTSFGYGSAESYTCNLASLVGTKSAALTGSTSSATPTSVTPEPVLYELYVRDVQADINAAVAAAQALASGQSSGNSASSVTPTAAAAAVLPVTLYPVPVRITNYRAADGTLPNDDTSTAAEANDVFFRRFALSDAVSGVTTVGDIPEILRYAGSMRLSFPTRKAANGRPNQLSVPVLTITYRERYASLFTTTASSSTSSSSVAAANSIGVSSTSAYALDSIAFAVEYTGENNEFGNAVIALSASLAVVVALHAAVKVSAWIRRNSRTVWESSVGLRHLGLWAYYLAIAFASSFFWLLWLFCIYWVVFFKLQTAVYQMLPASRPEYGSDDPYNPFYAGLVTIFVCFLVRLGELIRRQVTVDIFFIDWEKSRGMLVRTGAEHEQGVAASNAAAAAAAAAAGSGAAGAAASTSPPTALSMGNAGKFTPVSCWRVLHAANEWAELATQRRINLPLSLIILVVLLQGAGLQYVATPHPNAKDLTPGDLNPVLQFGNTVFWWFIIILCQLVYVVLVGERYIGENPSSRFIDLCTVAKVSVLIMDSKYRGWYLHCNAPHEHADGDMQQLVDNLSEEAAAVRVGRSLPGCPDPTCQSFELHVPAAWRETYDRVYRRLVMSDAAAAEAAAQAAQGAAMMGAGGGGLPGPGGAPAAAYGAYGGGAGYGMGGLVSGITSRFGRGAGGAGAAGAMSPIAKLKARTRRLHAASLALSAFLRAFIEESDPDFKRVWRERNLLQQLFDMPPAAEVDQAAAAVAAGAGSRLTQMVTDRSYRFERAIYRGIELDLAIFDILLFALVDCWQKNPIYAAVTVYIVDTFIAWCRKTLGNRNIAAKTLVDERFLE